MAHKHRVCEEGIRHYQVVTMFCARLQDREKALQQKVAELQGTSPCQADDSFPQVL
jgi:hypothetical protein